METSAKLDSFNLLAGIQYTVRFSDFTVGALLPADEGLYSSTTAEKSKPKNIQASTVQNDSNSTITATQSTSKTVSEALSSTVNHQTSRTDTPRFSYGEEVRYFTFYFIFPKISNTLQMGVL